MLSLREQRYLCLKSIYHFIKIVGGSINQGGIISKDIHKPLCHFFQDPNEKRVGILMPRDWRKSTCFTKWGAIWTYLRNPEERIFIIGETEKIASNMLDGIEHLILGCKKLRELFPELLVVDKAWTKTHKWSGVECMLPRNGFYSEPTITALGVGGASQSRHGTTVIFDDLCGKSAMESAVVLEDTLRWFDNYHELLVEPQPGKEDASRAIYVGTFWIIGDLPSYIMTEYKDEFKWRVVPALKASQDKVKEATKEKPHVQYIQNESQEVGESNWPEQFSTEHYTEMASNPQKQMIFWTQHMNMPTSADGINTIKYEWLKGYYFERDFENTLWVVCKDDEKRFRVSDMVIRAVIDPGGFAQGSGIKKGSRNAYVIVGQLRGSNRKFVLETWAQKIASPAAMMKQIFKSQEKWRVQSWHVEVYASQGYILKNIREEREKAGVRMIVMELPSEHTDDAKNKRIQGTIQPISNGEVYFHMETQRDIVAELINHPGGLTHDLADSLGWHAKMFWTSGLYGQTKNLNRKNLDAYIEARGAGR